ncbi:hypothetical protein LTR36_001145 [Oleoguttula mirabilis]|uniref:TATA element modulatory factor 1 TATA binding domain-containing protein n=1 Tax=Oleoguttula mirabilis TaxID=1507867 RepID=A0AAV9JQ28_9PEZI|nr:hypothetical protein LTR36_001145 [Oleoguttula mirabilis]
MTAPANKQPPKKGGWGSLLSGAVANLESRLDTILAEDNEASARQRAGETASQDTKQPRTDSGNLAPPQRTPAAGSRDVSRTRVNDRLAERLAKATAARTPSQAGSNVPSRVASPANDHGSVRTSGDSRRSGDIEKSTESMADAALEEGGTVNGNGEDVSRQVPDETGTLLSSGLPINPARVSADSSRPSLEVAQDSDSARPSSDLPIGHDTASAAEAEANMEQMRQDHAHAEKQRQEEMHAYLEKIDALQAKLQYLAKETVAAAKEANAATSTGSDEAKLAEKDERIALLMEEGEKLSKTELRHMQTIKKLRAKTSEEAKAAADVKIKLERAERAESDLKQKLRRAEAAERQATERAKQIVTIEKQVEELRIDRENASELIRTLTSELKQAKERADRAEKDASSKATEVDRNRIATLENELEDAQIEKNLADDRTAAETKKLREDHERQKERLGARELELRNEVASLEARLEAMRSRAEEASSEGTSSESSVKLMRQVETLQSQYSLAKGNWETIEGSLTARVSALEKERDEATRREAEVRKKARDAGARSRKVEEELETAQEQARTSVQELRAQHEEVALLSRRLEQGESAVTDARAELQRQRKLWDAEVHQRLEEEKLKWQRSAGHSQAHHAPSVQTNNSPSTRKASTADPWTAHSSRRPTNRITSHDLAALHTETQRATTSRRSSAMPPPFSARGSYTAAALGPHDRSADVSPILSRQESMLSLETAAGIPPTPSIEIDQQQEPDFEGSDSPQRTINDLVSTSTAGAGPSVQLVERMSAAVRRLESEKATFKDEIARLSSQRDEARNEVVSLMREMEGVRSEGKRVEVLEGEVKEVRSRYDASLEMLGEREEEVQELRQDVLELKGMYRELVEAKVGGSGPGPAQAR